MVAALKAKIQELESQLAAQRELADGLKRDIKDMEALRARNGDLNEEDAALTLKCAELEEKEKEMAEMALQKQQLEVSMEALLRLSNLQGDSMANEDVACD